MRVAVVAVVFALLTVPVVRAHEGHEHKIMGTIAAIRAGALDIKATTGKTASVILTEKTKIVRGTAAVKAADLKVGERVVATATETKEKTMLAKDVRVAPTR
jgi:hypothetical protein